MSKPKAGGNMRGRPSYLIVLVGSGYIGAIIALSVCWHLGLLLALLAAPAGGSLGVFVAALLLYLRERLTSTRSTSAVSRTAAGIKDAAL
jgi:hypothetical protein